MLSIQDVGTEIFEKRFKSVYIFAGEEYGIKQRYIDMIASAFDNKVVSVDTVSQLIDLLSIKHFIPLPPSVYVVRYDEEFISKLTKDLADKLLTLQFSGVVILLYEQPKHAAKCDKFLPDNTVSIDAVSDKFLFKYLRQDFPRISDRVITSLVKHVKSYFRLCLICRAIALDSNITSMVTSLSEPELIKLFGANDASTEQAIKYATASRSFKMLSDLLNNYEGNLDAFLYAMLSAVLEIEKILQSPHVESTLRQFADRWTLEDTYNMFMHIYQSFSRLRSTYSDTEGELIYLFSLLQFKTVPSIEVMK